MEQRRRRHCCRARRPHTSFIRPSEALLRSAPLGLARARADGSPTAAAQPHAVAAPRAAASANHGRPPPKNTAAKSAMKTNAHNFIHACHMNTVCVVIVLAKLIRAPKTADPVQCYPFLAFLWSYSVVKGGGDQLSGVHMSDGARTRTRPNVPRSPQAWSRPPSARRD